jgi:hypothetical protein
MRERIGKALIIIREGQSNSPAPKNHIILDVRAD